MLLQIAISRSPLQHHNVSLSSFSPSLPSGFRSPNFLRTARIVNSPGFRCSISQAPGFGTVDHERMSSLKWNAIFKKISLANRKEVAAATVLDQCENEGRRLTKWEVCRIAKELRKFKRFKIALEVYEWMNSKSEWFTLFTSDSAIQLDLIAKVRGISDAEDYFQKLPDGFKDKRTYGALLNAYVQADMKEKAEALLDKMRNRGYAMHPLPFNVISTLYMNRKEYDKVESIISEMKEKNVPLDIYSYNIWLSSSGSLESVEKMEQAFEQMKLDSAITPNWTTFSTMATVYVKLGQLEKAEDCLKKLESRIIRRERIPYHYLISLYSTIGKRDEVHRVWHTYKSIFPSIPNFGYHTMISSLVRVDDIVGAEQIYEEWLSLKSNYDPRIANLIIGLYIRKGLLEKAGTFFDRLVAAGGKANSRTWEILAEGQIGKRRIPDALSCLKQAALIQDPNWKPKPINVGSILKICEQENDTESKEILVGILRQLGCFEDEAYMSYIPLTEALSGDEPLIRKGITDEEVDEYKDGEGAEMLLNQLQENL